MKALADSINTRLNQIQAEPPRIEKVDSPETRANRAMLAELTTVLDNVSQHRTAIVESGVRFDDYNRFSPLSIGNGRNVDRFELGFESGEFVLKLGHEGGADAFLRDVTVNAKGLNESGLAEHVRTDQLEALVTKILTYVDGQLGEVERKTP